MIKTRHDEYQKTEASVPFIFFKDLVRNPFNLSREQNWHEDIEIQLCTKGTGSVLLNGVKYDFCENDIVAVNSNVIHYTGTENELTYSCIIISASFCRMVGFDYNVVSLVPIIKDAEVAEKFRYISEIYFDTEIPFRKLKLNEGLLSLLSLLSERYAHRKKEESGDTKSFDTVRRTVNFIRENYDRKITLSEIAKAVLTDKYSLCREFKRLTGQTVVEALNEYRCIRAKELLGEGMGVSESARLCGFENISFFTKTFKKYTGILPSNCKRK